jgi:2,3-bisphosphoglycerate-independent phosphoglycerate mutase
MGGDDEIIAFNFRADRMREIIPALFDPAFAEFDRKGASPLSITTMTEYKETFDLPVAFDSHPPKNGLGEVLAAAGKKQLRTAETEKYAHVTFFFNGGVETPNAGEERQLVSSPRVRTYDLKPEMSCPEVTDGVVAAIASGAYDLIVVNLANGDMVGHTGVWEAALQAVATIDEAVDRIIAAAEKVDAHLLITADHGNIEKMVEHGKPMTAHTTNPVPFYYVGTAPVKLREGGKLADVAPTILTLMGIDIPPEMTGASLLVPATQSS